MKKYEVYVKEVSYGMIVVEAENEDQAWDRATEVYEEGNTSWGKLDFDITEVHEVQE